MLVVMILRVLGANDFHTFPSSFCHCWHLSHLLLQQTENGFDSLVATYPGYPAILAVKVNAM